MSNDSQLSPIAVYRTKDGNIRIETKLTDDTVWLTLNQLAELFQVDKSGISRHLKNIFDSEELVRNSVVAKFATTATDGKTYQVEHFNLDAIISVGYRVKSRVATRFRKWATDLLREHLIKGYTLDQKRLRENSGELSKALDLIRRSADQVKHLDEGRGLVEIISRYTQTFLWLQQYDEGVLTKPDGTAGGNLMRLEEAQAALQKLKGQLIDQEEGSDLFARDKKDGLAAIWGALNQSAFGEEAYPTIESKAAHLLYFVVKNHPFIDGNKRCAAFLFVYFLNDNNHLFNAEGKPVIEDSGLAALTLLVAESAPKERETVLRLILNILTQDQPK